jgi:hypothetical protein
MDTAAITIYILLGLLAIAYAGVIVYHIFRYRVELPPPQLRQVTSVLVIYLVFGALVLLTSIGLAIFVSLNP